MDSVNVTKQNHVKCRRNGFTKDKVISTFLLITTIFHQQITFHSSFTVKIISVTLYSIQIVSRLKVWEHFKFTMAWQIVMVMSLERCFWYYVGTMTNIFLGFFIYHSCYLTIMFLFNIIILMGTVKTGKKHL
jgi:hypothetical protein